MADKVVGQHSIKHDIISKANTTMFAAVSIAVFVVVFCIFAAKGLISQSAYQSRVISEKEVALRQLEANKTEAEALRESYVAFATEPINILGGSPTGTGPKDGDNAKLILDSLPYELDFPALSSSIEKILTEGGYIIQAIGGSDSDNITVADPDQAAAEEGAEEAFVPSEPVFIEFPFTVTASPESALTLLQTLERSIRPFNVTSLSIEGSGSSLDLSINMFTYYKPETSMQVNTKVVE